MKGNKGFTLVEMAIVLVIIGIILGAVVKGNDLITSAKQKSVMQIPTKWEIPIWNYYDKKGKFPGAGSDGLITNITDLTGSLATYSLAYPETLISEVTVDIASTGTPCGGTARNYMKLSSVELDTAKSLDLNVDGKEDGTTGRVRNCSGGASVAWGTDATTTVYYFFDKQP